MPVSRVSRVAFFGTDSFAACSLASLTSLLHRGTLERVAVVCPPARPRGRRSPAVPAVLQAARAADLPVHLVTQPPGTSSVRRWSIADDAAGRVFRAHDYDLGVVVSFGYFLQPSLITGLRHGAVNVHPSLLPQYRGPAPIHAALRNADTETGVSLITVDPQRFDTGDILAQERVSIDPTECFPQLHDRLASLGARMLHDVLPALPAALATAQAQQHVDDTARARAPKPARDLGHVDPTRQSSSEIFNIWRAIGHAPGVRVCLNNKLVLRLSQLGAPTMPLDIGSPSLGPVPAGSILRVRQGKQYLLRCCDGLWLPLLRVQPAGRRDMDMLAFANGYLSKHERVIACKLLEDLH